MYDFNGISVLRVWVSNGFAFDYSKKSGYFTNTCARARFELKVSGLGNIYRY
jgi:hypothetical protein